MQAALLSETELRAQSGVHHTVVLDSIMNDKSIQKKAQSHPQQSPSKKKLRQTYRLKSSEAKNYKSHGCIQQSALWMDGIAATWVTRTSNRLKCVRVCKAVLVCFFSSTGPGSENSPKACVLKQTKHVYFKLKQYAPDIRTSLCSVSFSLLLARNVLFGFTV